MPNALNTIQAKYREVFVNSTLGRDVLGDILTEFCHFGSTLDGDNKQQIGEYNVGIAILHRCGIISEDTLEDVIRALANVVPKINQEE